MFLSKATLLLDSIILALCFISFLLRLFNSASSLISSISSLVFSGSALCLKDYFNFNLSSRNSFRSNCATNAACLSIYA